MTERGDLLGQHYGMPHWQDEDARGDLDFLREGRGEGQRVERLQPRVAVETRRREEMVDDPDVDPVVLALLDGLADAPDVLGIALAAGPRVGRNPGAEFQLRHRGRPPGSEGRLASRPHTTRNKKLGGGPPSPRPSPSVRERELRIAVAPGGGEGGVRGVRAVG